MRTEHTILTTAGDFAVRVLTDFAGRTVLGTAVYDPTFGPDWDRPVALAPNENATILANVLPEAPEAHQGRIEAGANQELAAIAQRVMDARRTTYR